MASKNLTFDPSAGVPYAANLALYTGTIVNVNSLDYQHYVSSRNAKELKNERVDSMEQDLANLKGEIGEIKSLLKELVNGK